MKDGILVIITVESKVSEQGEASANRTKACTKSYDEGWERIFGVKLPTSEDKRQVH